MPILIDEESETSEPSHINLPLKQSRNFLTFSDQNLLKEIFSNTTPEVPKTQKCPITGLTAKYFDPLTKTPYANLNAFKKIREIKA